ncbi:MAG: cytochrome P450, partial [Acidimicrobiales bacterium]|nr:cytochrome P450 [Acidimicrobiales bacterium]
MEPVEFNPYAHEVHEDPFPYYRRLRDEAPAYYNAELDFWALSRYDDVITALHDPTTFCSRYGITLEPKSPLPMMITMDPPEHTAMRRLVSRVFTPRRVSELEPQIRALSDKHLRPWRDAGRCDVIADYSAKLPMDVISTMLGVPEDDQDMLRGWADDMIHREEGIPDITPRGIDAAAKLYAYFVDQVSQKRRRPGDDLISGLLDAEIDGARLDLDAVVGFCFLLVIAGNETTTKLIGNAIYWLWRNPDQRAKLHADPRLIPDAVEETLRYEGSTQVMAVSYTHL